MGGMGSSVLDTSGWDDCHEDRQQSEDFFNNNGVLNKGVIRIVIVTVVFPCLISMHA